MTQETAIQADATRVLLVEDSPTESMLIQAALEDAEDMAFNVYTATSLEETISHLKHGEFDIVILDLTLPDSSGLSTFAKVHHEFPDVPIIIMTANKSKTDAVNSVKSGAQDYIVKENITEMQLGLPVRYAIERKKSEDVIKKANEELEDFAYTISHDLKAPLRGIKNLTEMIVQAVNGQSDDDPKELCDLLCTQANRMQKLIDGVLEYSDLTRTQGQNTQVDLNEAVKTAIELLAPPENISITIESELPVIEAQQAKIVQIFSNLLDNAVKFMDKPQGTVQISSHDKGGFWQINVTDSGPGIPKEHLERVFRIFTTLKPKSEYEGSGIGLAKIKKIVEMTGGKIWAQSEEGNGSTFSFTLPKSEE